ncbi:MAG: glycosyltransferase family 4 protein [Chloroflexi bacterium]|nr:MAG: glycosyltransferase family 4 protein [Chloroflexota bacterium]
MRVVIAKKTLSTVGGSETFARALDRELRALGHDVALVGMRPAWFRPGIADDARSTFLDVRFGRLGAAIDGLLPTTLVRDQDLRRVISGADVVHSLAREWAGALERAARAEGAAFVETPLVHPGQPFSGDTASDLARYRRADAVIALTNWEATWYRERGVSHVHVTGVGPNLVDLPEVAREPATILFVGRKEVYKGYYSLRRAARMVWRERADARFVAIGQPAWFAQIWPILAMRDPRWVDHDVVSERVKAEALARATIFAMPSDHETFGHTSSPAISRRSARSCGRASTGCTCGTSRGRSPTRSSRSFAIPSARAGWVFMGARAYCASSRGLLWRSERKRLTS